MAGHPQSFPPVPNQPIASYDWIDIEDGTGIVVFYAMTTGDASATQYRLFKQAIISKTTSTKADSGNTDFVLNFNIPRDIEGDALLKVQWTVSRTSSGAAVTGDLTASILKNSDVLVSVAATQLSTTSLTDGSEVMKIPIPRTHFAVGDTLTLRFTTVKHADAEGLWIIHDPLDVDVSITQYGEARTKTKTKLQIYIPFRLNS